MILLEVEVKRQIPITTRQYTGPTRSHILAGVSDKQHRRATIMPYTCTLLNYAIILDCVWAKLNICNGDCAKVQLIVPFDHLQLVYPVIYHFAKAGAI